MSESFRGRYSHGRRHSSRGGRRGYGKSPGGTSSGGGTDRDAYVGGRGSTGGDGGEGPGSTNFPTSWQDFPSQEDIKQKRKELEIAMQSQTIQANDPLFVPSELDVQTLLAAISKIEKKEQVQVASQRLTPKDESRPPNFSPTRGNGRLSKVLDSLANLCVSQTQHEVIATALRVDNKAQSIELIIASNTDVQTSTVAHLQKMWKILQRYLP